MRWFALVLLLVAGLWPCLVSAQTPPLPSETPTPMATPAPQLLGATLAPVPDVLYAQVPSLSKGHGLLVEAVAKDSVADKIGLRQHDIILKYGGTTVQEVKQLATLLWTTPPGQSNKFVVIRGGKIQFFHYIFKAADLPAASTIKPGGPPAVNLEVAPLANDRMKVTFTYYAGGGGSKLQTFTCEGTVDEIAHQVQHQKPQVPGQVQELLDVAVNRLRMMKMRN